MDTMSYIIGRNSAGGGGEVTSLPWNKVTSKPFNTVDTTTGLTIVNNTLMLETLDHVATIDYVDSQIDSVTTTMEDDYALKSEIPDVSDFITASALTPYVESSDLASVATSGDYDDLINKPTIPAATSVTVTQGLTTGITVGSIDVDGVTTTLYAPAGGSGGSIDWADITNKPSIASGTGSGSIIECYIEGNEATGLYAHAEGIHTKAVAYSHAEGANTEAKGWYSHTEGAGTKATAAYQHVQGQFNIPESHLVPTSAGFYLDIVGNGTNITPSNAEATDWSGNKYLAGDVYAGVTNWTDPQTYSAKIPKEADWIYASRNDFVTDPHNYGNAAQDIMDSQQYDANGNPEYLGVDDRYMFVYSAYNNAYCWECISATCVPNPDYNPDAQPEEPDPSDGGEVPIEDL